MKINYQEYLMQIGAAPKLVKMAAVIKNIEFLRPQPSKEQILVADNGDIIVMLESSLMKIQLDGEEAIVEKKEFNSDMISVIHIDKSGVEYLKGRYQQDDAYKREKVGNSKVDPSNGYCERKGKLIATHDSYYAQLIQDGDWGREVDHDGSCFLKSASGRLGISLNSEEIRDTQLKSMAVVMTSFPTSINYYLENGYVNNENMQELLLEGLSKLIDTYRSFIENNGKENYPAFLDGFIERKSQEEIDKENEAVRLEIVKYEEILKKIKNGEKLYDPTENYTEELASEIRKRTVDVMENNLMDMINAQKDINREQKEKYAYYIEILKKLTANIMFRSEALETYKKAIGELKKEPKGLGSFKSNIKILELCEVLIGVKFIGKVHDDACKEIEKFFKKYNENDLKGKYFNRLVEPTRKTK